MLGMKSFSDLSFREKRAIADGEVSSYKYGTGYDFRVKSAVRDGLKKKEDEEKAQK